MRKITTLDVTTSSILKQKQKVAAYMRVSTSNEEQLIRIEAQRRHYKIIIEKSDEWQLVDIYSDEGLIHKCFLSMSRHKNPKSFTLFGFFERI